MLVCDGYRFVGCVGAAAWRSVPLAITRHPPKSTLQRFVMSFTPITMGGGLHIVASLPWFWTM